jgi:hypothetical protein
VKEEGWHRGWSGHPLRPLGWLGHHQTGPLLKRKKKKKREEAAYSHNVIGSKAKVINHDKPLSKKESCEITKLQEDSQL